MARQWKQNGDSLVSCEHVSLTSSPCNWSLSLIDKQESSSQAVGG